MRTMNGVASMAIDARAATSAEGAALITDASAWGGTTTSCVGAHMVYCPISLAAGASVVLDESMDWRDRVCIMFGSVAESNTEDRRPAGANEFEILPLIAYRGWKGESFYSAGGWDAVGARGGVNRFSYAQVLEYVTPSVRDIFLYADSANGKLTLKNGVGTKITGVLTIWATEQTGKLVAVP